MPHPEPPREPVSWHTGWSVWKSAQCAHLAPRRISRNPSWLVCTVSSNRPTGTAPYTCAACPLVQAWPRLGKTTVRGRVTGLHEALLAHGQAVLKGFGAPLQPHSQKIVPKQTEVGCSFTNGVVVGKRLVIGMTQPLPDHIHCGHKRSDTQRSDGVAVLRQCWPVMEPKVFLKKIPKGFPV